MQFHFDLKTILSNRLVHGGLSEFNLLYHEGKAYVIDVSQSVEHDHPRALDFLRKDLQNVTEFFRRKGVNVLGVRGLFDFVVDPSIEAGEAEEAALQGLNARAEAMTEEERSAEQIVQEEVFKNIHIPRTLDEVTFLVYHMLRILNMLFGSWSGPGTSSTWFSGSAQFAASSSSSSLLVFNFLA